MAKKKNVDLLKYWRINKKYGDVPINISDQYELIMYAYPRGYVWGRGGGISLEEACQRNERISYNVAKSIIERSHKKISDLNELEKLILKQLDKIDRGRDEMDIERLYIMIQDVADNNIPDRIDNVAKRILGKSLSQTQTFLN